MGVRSSSHFPTVRCHRSIPIRAEYSLSQRKAQSHHYQASNIMTFQLKYRGIPFEYQTTEPAEAVREACYRGRKTLISNAPKPTATSPDDVQFFGWHAAGLAIA